MKRALEKIVSVAEWTLLIAFVGSCVGLILAGIITTVYNSEKASASSVDSSEKGRAEWSDCVYLFTDPETKVQYIYFFSCGKAGVCPRYTADGGLYVENGKNKSTSF